MQKPDSCIYLEAANRLGVAALDCVFVGDGGSNELEGARRVGMKAILAKWYTNQHPHKRENMAEHFFDNYFMARTTEGLSGGYIHGEIKEKIAV